MTSEDQNRAAKQGLLQQAHVKTAIVKVDKFIADAIAGGSCDGKYDDVDPTDQRLRTALLTVAKLRDITFEDLNKALSEIFHLDNYKAIKNIREIFICQQRSADLKVYYVENTSHKKLTVLAQDINCARFFARRSRHILEDRNGLITVLKPDHEAALRRSGEALGQALRDGYPGVVTEFGDNVVMERWNRVYTPMTVVGDGSAES